MQEDFFCDKVAYCQCLAHFWQNAWQKISLKLKI